MNTAKLEAVVGREWVTVEKERLEDYLVDETATDVRPQPASEVVLVKPASSEEISRILKLANEEKIPVFPRGGGTGLCGGAVPTDEGIILSVERMNKIQIDKDNLMAIAEAGVTLNHLIEEVEQGGLFFPPHPGDVNARVGGLVACNAGGSRAIKHGIMRNYVKGLEVVLPMGEVLTMGGKLLKNNTGYNLMHLIIGSEGTLAIITRVIFRLYPPVAAGVTMIIPYNSRHGAINTVPKILQSGLMPLAIEYLDRDIVDISARHLGTEWPTRMGLAYLMIILTGASEEELYSDCERTAQISKQYGGLEAIIGVTKKEQDKVLKIRSNIYLALKRRTADILDVAVPPASMGMLMDTIEEIARRYDTIIPMYGHAGDGNLHPHLMKYLVEKGGREKFRRAKREIYEQTIKLGGVITAEHGLGRIRIEDLDILLSETEIKLMAGIKKVFDPNGILNPGCVLKIK